MLHPVIPEQLRLLNKECFGTRDWYSCAPLLEKTLADPSVTMLTMVRKERLLAYYLLKEHADHVEGLRLAVVPDQRNKRLGRRLLRRAMQHARSLSKPFRTYTVRRNLVSANLHIRCGMKLERVDRKYIYLTTG